MGDFTKGCVTLAGLRSTLAAAIVDLPVADLPAAVGAFEEAKAEALRRLLAPPASRAVVGELVPAEVVAKQFHLAVSSVHELARQGRIPHRMFGRYRRFDLAEVAAEVANSEIDRLEPPKKPRRNEHLVGGVTGRSPRAGVGGAVESERRA